MTTLDRGSTVPAIEERLTELGARIGLEERSGKTVVRFESESHVASHWIEIGFLLGQWALLAGIQFPRDFSRRKMSLSEAFRFDVDPGGMDFTFVDTE